MPEGWPANELASTLVRRFAGSLSNTDFRRISHDRLMEESQRLISSAALSGQPIEERVASRILDNPRDYRRWEDEHAALMRRTATERLPISQRGTLLETSLALIHRKALFEYLRDQQVRGKAREALIGHFFTQRDYAAAVVGEHGRYLRSAASFLCSSYVGRNLMFDTLFEQPLAEYEERYAQYFRGYCDLVVIPANDPRRASLQALLPVMKMDISEWRRALLALTQSQSGVWRRPQF